MENIRQYFECFPGTPRGRRSSVHYGSTYRLDKARKQASFPPVCVDEIITYVNDFLKAAGMNIVESPRRDVRGVDAEGLPEINYEEIKAGYALKDIRDIVWMKFTTDKYLGVVAAGNDINFDIPSDEAEYDEKESEMSKKWKHTTAGILVHQLGKR